MSKACNLLSKYQQGSLFAIDFENRSGRLKLGIKKDKNGQYPD
ncbi:MAG: hypothetical protein AAF195_01455 [Pseudomonadota bacterium]